MSADTYSSYVTLVSDAVQATSEAIKYIRKSDLRDVNRTLGDAYRLLSEADATLRRLRADNLY